MTQVHVPPLTREAADAALAEAHRIQSAVAGGFSTEAGLELAEAAAERLIDTARNVRMQVRQLRGQARRSAQSTTTQLRSAR